MKIEEIRENYYFETLNENHDLSEFNCSDDDLNDFLKNDAMKLQNSKLSLTKLIICNSEIIGFVSLLTDAIVIKNIRNEKIKLDIKEKLNISTKNKLIPAVKIGRLALDKKNSGKGLGSQY